MALFLRARGDLWLRLADRQNVELGSNAKLVLDVLRRRGASFFHELVAASGLLRTHVEDALGELAGAGYVTSDSFAGLRALITPAAKKAPWGASARTSVETAGRWSLLESGGRSEEQGTASEHRLDTEAVEAYARVLLRRWGVIFRRLASHDGDLVPWRELVRIYRRLEARGEIRGGRFVAGFSGEQFALSDAVAQLRATRKEAPGDELITISAADPLNLTAVLTPDERVPAITSNRVVFRDGVPVGARIRREVRVLPAGRDLPEGEVRTALTRSAAAVRSRHAHQRGGSMMAGD